MNDLRFKYQNISIIGAGESGIGAAILALKHGKNVWLSDANKIKEQYISEIKAYEIPYEENGHDEDRILHSDLIIKSPGIPHKAEIIKKAKALGIPIISEVEFAYWFTNAKIIGITGSNGKTTTTLLTYKVFKAAELNVGMAGNIGKSFAKSVAEDSFEYYILEISSFQLDDIIAFRCDTAILLNITPDHLDRYNYEMEKYVESKFNITKFQNEDDYFIYNDDDEEMKKYLLNHTTKAKMIPISLEKEYPENGGYSIGNELIIKLENKEKLDMNFEEFAIKGKHNRYNSMAAGIAAKIEKIRDITVKEAMGKFTNISHRIEMVAKVNEITFINDSKATNVNSVWYALESIRTPMIWIAGGVDKGNDYTSLYPLVKERVRMLICLGTDNTPLKEAFKDEIHSIKETTSMDEAVKMAFNMALAGDTVLFSPACASFDLFQNFEDRGDKFKAAVHGLIK